MGQVFFLDTDVILDYLEKRNQDVTDVIAQLLHFHGRGKIVLATSVFNVAELIDNEFQIRFIGECMNERMSGDEIISKLRDKELYRQISPLKGIRFFVIAQSETFPKFQTEVSRMPFSKIKERYNFESYEKLIEFFSEAEKYHTLRKDFGLE